MADIKLFRLGPDAGSVQELQGASVQLEKSLQTLIERNLETLLAVRFLASEVTTGKSHAGRIDTLGIDENGSPVIIEYKRSMNENVINQGLFYLNWLLDHKADFKLMVLDQVGKDAAATIDWTGPRLVCIAGDFTKYDEHAVQQINRNIELIRYRKFADDLLLFELVNATVGTPLQVENEHKPAKVGKTPARMVAETLADADPSVRDLFENIKAFLTSLGDDVHIKEVQAYFAFKRIKNFACVEVFAKKLKVFVKVPPNSITLEKGFTRDVSEIGHVAPGDLEITINTLEEVERAKPLLVKSYEIS